MNPQLSVVIPTYKRTDSLERLLDCLFRQNDVNLEIIVLNQNAPGFFTGTLEAKLNSVKCIRQENPNASLARNLGFQHAEAPYILFLDDDLIPEPDFCSGGLAVFAQYPSIRCFVPLVYSHLGKQLSLSSANEKLIKFHDDNKEIYAITETISAAVFFERGYFELSGGFDVHLFDFAKTSEDQEFFLRMLKKKMELWFVPFVEIFHDEKVEGGCELRTSDYWNTRKKCSRALALRYRIQKKTPGSLSIADMVQLSRSAFLNKKVLLSGFGNIVAEIKLLIKSIKESKDFFHKYESTYKMQFVNFIER